MKEITSIQNPFIKNILKLQEKARERKKQGFFLIEGKREIQLAKKGGYEITSLLFLSTVINDTLLIDFQDIEQILISQEIYDKLAYRNTTEGFLAIAKTKSLSLSDIKLSENSLILVAESIEKPGNLGAILRTADAANINAVLIADAKSDLYNPNIIRSSVGCVFTNQIAIGTSEEIITFLREKKIQIFAATLQNSNEYYLENFTKPSAIVVGTEDTGLTEIWRTNATQNINIPMQGMIDSMNVSVAAAILLFEAKRQRNFK
ncbi:MAG: RNA methyltransferase [Flavobacteriia bacterium]|nr:RNA methyltransferase [Flavobacteriia bacterium]OIP48461.1 MAG: rRNA methyltransferase [Flavobacteriaceae bacterium CG2_30_31_66]PIV97501.1 MAG: rRNA methyltransferase [Flavobacteriaceae bacterium CG17_big_fil_post_rev_8_21_14_2_50_31_13]PIX13119.1 MAG: rRNA methyltransferase [Flavobacteriaceae bacterium CG_4_8_14_3_um_filter_31_8]PIY14297.1 MAG: rRNA methyltransferase [Flavobacteriaceae bacterium CG_4_10_14_3_um_filter_31_253]PIZ10149.1 MAG: rRNA methyltransferase [Flavobacteriaceae bacter